MPEDEDWTGVQIDWFTIHERFKRYQDFPTDEPAQYHKYRYFGYVFKENTPVASDFEWFDLQQTSITNDKYTHIVYSDNADGSNFGREPKKYMGVARTTSPKQPTDKAAYKWFKVKGEDGADGKSINENLIPNSNFAKDLDNWEMARLINSGLNYQKGHAIQHFGRGLHIWGTPNGNDKGLGTVPFNFIAKQGEKITLSMDLGKDALNNYSTLYLGIHYLGDDNSLKGQQWQELDLTAQNFEVKKYKRISRTFTVGSDVRKCRVMIHCKPQQTTNFYIDNIKLERGEVATEWSPAYEDLQAHSLTANLRFEGTYINNITNNVRPYLDVFYDGQKVNSGFNAQVKYKGGNSYDWSGFWTAEVDSNGRINNINWGNREQNGTPLEVIVLITYKGLNTIANARLDNLPDTTEIKEVVKKYKTFESTIDQFNSTIGEVKQQILANEEKRNLILGSRILNQSDYKEFGKLWDKASDQGISSSIRQDLNANVPMLPNGNPYLLVVSLNNPRISWQGVGFNLSKKDLYKGQKYSLRVPILLWNGFPKDGDVRVELKNHDKNKVIWGERLDHMYMPANVWYIKEFNFTINENVSLSDYSLWFYNVKNGAFCISSPFMCEGDTLPKNYSPSPDDVRLQNSRIESSIKQTKDEIDLKVSKDNVINSINISAEGTKIKGDLIADYLYGKTIEGAILKGNSQIRIGKHGYMIPAGNGLRFCLPKVDNANNGVGMQLLGNYGREGNSAYGLYLYVDPNFDTTETASTNSYLMTVNGYIKAKGINNLKFQSYIDGSTGIGVWNKNVELMFDNADNDIYYAWGDKKYSLWKIIKKHYDVTSDIRLKKDIKNCEYKALEKIDLFNFKSFNWVYREDFGQKPYTEIGLIAQEVEEISENFVSMAGEYKTLDQFNLLTFSLKAIQELSTENRQLKSQLNEMNERLTKLEDKINGNL